MLLGERNNRHYKAQLQVVDRATSSEIKSTTGGQCDKMDWFEGRSVAAISGRQIAMVEDRPRSSEDAGKTTQDVVRSDAGPRAGFKCVEALGRIIIRGPIPPSNAIIYMHLQL